MHSRFRLLVPAVAALALVTLPLPIAGAAPNPGLARLCDEYWQGFLLANPTYATSLGDHRYDDRLGEITPEAAERERVRLEDVLARARAFDEAALDPADRLNRSALIETAEGQLANLSCGFEDWVVDPVNGPQVDFFNLPDLTVIRTPEDADRYVARCRAMGRYLDDHIANLRRGLGRGRVAARGNVVKVQAQLDGLLATQVTDWTLVEPAKAPRKGWPAGRRDGFRAALVKALTDSLRPGLVRYQDLIRNEILPAARPPEKAGLVSLPGGLECYQKRIRVETSLDLSPRDLHRLGAREVRQIRDDMEDLGARVFDTGDLRMIQRHLRGDSTMRFSTAVEVESKARESLARAKAAIPKWFGILPQADCEVKVMGMHEAPQSTIAYYRNPTMDGSRPGYYMLNTYRPETRPRYEAEALAFHEAIPGHHLQIAIAMELKDLPEFRKHLGVTAFVEGWALYTERLANEMGLYSGDLDRIGMLSYDAWRACRLVVDTGLHAMGWSRQQAIDYMIENTALAPNNIENEVDRYITWPGQALAYKVGQLEILKLREEAKTRLGARFDIRAFHDTVLRNGALSLPVLRGQVEAWIAEVERGR